MNRLDHRITGAVSGATYAAAFNLPPTATVGCMWLASITAAGKTSPDVDQYPQWHGRDKDIPQWRWVRWLNRFLLWVGPNNHGDPIDHRRFTHWPGIPAAVSGLLWWGWTFTADTDPAASTGLLALLAALVVHYAFVAAGALVTGWTSHLVVDLPFGKRSRYRGAGIPWMPWWAHHGANLKSGGWLAHGAVWLIIIPGGLASFLRFDVVEATARTCLGS